MPFFTNASFSLFMFVDRKSQSPHPEAHEIPAMTAVIQGPRLLFALLQCLKNPPTDDPESVPPGHHQRIGSLGGHGITTGRGGRIPHRSLISTTVGRGRGSAALAGRKRGLSFTDQEPNSYKNLQQQQQQQQQQSPMIKTNMTSLSSTPSSTPSSSSSPEIPLRILAATLITAAFLHLDHWPALLVQAYSEDAFGQRSWVDDIRCSLLVENLKLCHEDGDTQMADNQALTEAAQVAYFYDRLMNQMADTPDTSKADNTFTRSSADRSMSIDSVDATQAVYQSSSVDTVDFPNMGDSDSDSGDEEIIEVSIGNATLKDTSELGNSSSSGEEDFEEEENRTNSTYTNGGHAGVSRQESRVDVAIIHPIKSVTMNLQKVRHRYVGVNLQMAYNGILKALQDRLEIKWKQNLNLLKALPSFTSIPGIRALTANRLGQWLQSPALSGPARALFASTVNHMKNSDPPLLEDIEAIDAILSMRLKSNQLNIHIENITNIARKIPTGVVSRLIYFKLLKEELAHIERDPNQVHSEHLQMIGAVHVALDASLSCDGLAAAILTLLVDEDFHANKIGQQDRHKLIRKIRIMIRRIALTLGASFDGCRLMESLLSFDVGVQSWSIEDEEDKGRILLECVTTLIPPIKERDDSVPARGKNSRKLPTQQQADILVFEEDEEIKKKLIMARKFLISWCCSEYAPMIQAKQNTTANIHEMIIKRTLKVKKGETPAGAGMPDFSSILDGQDVPSKEATCPLVIKCVLFMVEPESKEMQSFLYPDIAPPIGEPMWIEEQLRIRQCYDYGADLDDEMIWIILQLSTQSDRTLDSVLALAMLEHLFECCRNDRKATMSISDPRIVWEMYKLAEYKPAYQHFPISNDDTDTDESRGEENGAKKDGSMHKELPRLAYPGQWWRVTAIALVMCGGAPKGVGEVLCGEHPTIQALVKMVVSGRYRFPTVDCNELTRETMKEGEFHVRNEESRITELLFLPPQPKIKCESKSKQSAAALGSRTSSRTRERLERIDRQNREKEVSDALAAAQKRKKMLKTAQKSIMVWEPKGTARKPPKECMNLFLSIEDMFSLANTFRRSIAPDFVLIALGSTTRGAIERAYDWLIPVVSMLPSIIGRLPASASCFLLLRAFGSESEGNNELRQLSAPLLDHVTKTIGGEYGKVDAVGAIDLLLADVADKKPERRRCARKVLQEALTKQNATVTDKSFHAARCTWLHGLLLVEHASAIVASSIHYLSQALKYESGRVLRAELISLDIYIRFAATHDVTGSWDFSSILCGLISKRHTVFSDVINRFADLQTLSVKVIHVEFKSYLWRDRSNDISINDCAVDFIPCWTDALPGGGDKKGVTLSLSLLESTCVLLSTWKMGDLDTETISDSLITELANILMHPYEIHQNLQTSASEKEGAVGAVLKGNGKPAVNVEQWVLLAKSRTDFIARRAALSAPTKFLPRLLLCSGLPHSSLITMIDRLGILGARSKDANKIYRDLMIPSATSDWSISHVGGRKELARKLIGRLSAYLKHGNGSSLGGASQTFLSWLAEECTNHAPDKLKKRQQRKVKAGIQSQLSSAFSSIGNLELTLRGMIRNEDLDDMDFDDSNPIPTLMIRPVLKIYEDELPCPDNAGRILVFIRDCIEDNQVEKLELWIDDVLSLKKELFLQAGIVIDKLVEIGDGASTDLNRLIINWMPQLVVSSPKKHWGAIFTSAWKGTIGNEILSRCACSWSEDDIQACLLWTFQLSMEDRKGLDLHRLVNFIVIANDRQISSYEDFGGRLYSKTGVLQLDFHIAIMLAIECSHTDDRETIEDRNAVPAWLQLLLEAGHKDKATMCYIIGALLHEIGLHHDNKHLKSAVLRLYSSFPTLVNLGNANLRNVLVDSCKSSKWLTWRSPFDAQIDDMVQTMRLSPSPRLVQGLVDLAKSHPLLVLRDIRAMKQVLEIDGMCRDFNRDSRSRVWGENRDGPAIANYQGGTVRIKVQHWGYMFTDSLWVAILETLLSIPREVLFPCGLTMGIEELLGTYVKLLFIQSELQNRDRIERLKGRFTDLLAIFASSDSWGVWLASNVNELKSFGSIRDVLVSCSINTTGQAIASI